MVEAREPEAVVVVDLGFGDAGKGAVTDFLVRRLEARAVVRFNGGAQAGHNVVTPDGRHHTFAQFGAGSFVPGVRTYLSRYMIVHPTALLYEARRLDAVGVPDALARLSVSEDALVITPFQQAAGRLRELGRGEGRHGSCGVGVGEAMRDSLSFGDEVIRMRHLRDRSGLKRALERIQARKYAEMEDISRAREGDPAVRAEWGILSDPKVVDAWIEAIMPLSCSDAIVGENAFARLLEEQGALIFEGAQGVLLDEWRGFHPYTTWSTCTFDNALSLLSERAYGGKITKLGVLRSYATRHGAGPFPTESQELGSALREQHNGLDAWQGAFRRGWPDELLLRYAIDACGGVDGLALTHVDALSVRSPWRLCRGYRARKGASLDVGLFVCEGGEARSIRLGPFRDLGYQEALGRALFEVEPLFEDVTAGELVGLLEERLRARVMIQGRGPSALDFQLRTLEATTR